jgi:hypothetical protein
MPNRGFQGFRKPEKMDAETLKARLSRMNVDGRFIFWTGGTYRSRSQSLRSNSLATITEKKRPISFKVWLDRAAHAAGPEMGYTPERVVEGLYLHKGAKPCVYIELTKDAKGNFVSAQDCPYADSSMFPKGLKRGDIVVSAKADKAQPTKGKAKKVEAPAIEEQPQA